MDTNDRSQFQEWLARAVEALGLSLESSQADRLYAHLNLVLLANEDFNLTRVTNPAEAAVRLVADSLAVLSWVQERFRSPSPIPQSPLPSARSSIPVPQSPLPSPQSPIPVCSPFRVLDMGSGAGYPSIPLAICRPDWTVTAIDTVGKKVRFLAQAAGQLNLANFLPEQIQAREWHGRVAPFDLVVTRAMGDLSMVVREGARLLKPTGYLVSYHAEEITPQERKAADKMLARYKLQQIDSFEYSLPDPKKSVPRRLIVMGK